MLRFTAVIGILLLAGFCQTEDTGARLLASKNILNQWLVEGKDLTVAYNIYNVGSSAALKVELRDETFPTSDFQNVHGKYVVTWDRLAPGSNVSHTVIVRPLQAGFFNFTAATISYIPQEDAQPQFGYTSAPGEGGIMSLREYDRKFSPHYMDWLAFAVMTLPSIGIPFMLWYRSKSKYEKPVEKKSKKH
ncbi:translocon-associated protein subunit beta-like [Saccoglossus kowalevskii]|uniref:Translocon-associated protein subunit beta n=1 Tax=Saccoglossus kowalevskii TaxID=10224 RepID=A0ABM0GZ01_SACKO|nr:PREDICTED: translocon-associated protein subunit beta-like [Saccoglossus kowalevskii]